MLGSRYVPGGGVRNWGSVRRLVSRGGCWYARTVLGVDIRDLTGGFKCFRREVLETLDLDERAVRGLCVPGGADLPGARAGFRVKEIPIVFSERRRGESKMSRRIMLEAITDGPSPAG